MVYNLQESNSTTVEDRRKYHSYHIKSIVEEIGVKEVTGGTEATEVVVNVLKVGKAVPGPDRPVKVVLSSSRLVKEIIKKKSNLKKSEVYSKINLESDLTPKQRENLRKLRGELIQRKDNGEKLPSDI
ncbi:hypothetical protein HHI36_015066 [Cryptolaemus montrouzieri]|uniref:Uncharacterized protein n=1 Tax=Cryptolaemus montrouzieri TaxID=559131 RepID=A0ABD2N5R0_9CUCU